MKYLLILVMVFLISSCGIEDEPKASRKDIQPDNVVGTWVDESSAVGKASAVTLKLDMKGTFTITGSLDNDGYGTWKIGDGNMLILIYSNKDKVNSTWYVADAPDGGFAIVGSSGNGLPRNYLKKVQ